MSILTQQTLAVARTEWRATWRGRSLTLVMLILALPFIPYLLLPRTSFDDNGLQIFTFVAPLVGLLASFLIVPSLRRERRAGLGELTWARPLDSLAYVTGKVAAAVLVMAVLLAELTALVAITQATAGFSVSLAIAGNALLLVAPTLLCLAALYIICGALLPHPLAGYLLAIALAFGVMFFFNKSALYLWNPYLIAVFYSKALGFGLDGPLLLANRLFYLGLTVILAGAAIAAFARRERRALAPRRQVYTALAVLLCGMTVAGSGVLRFQAARTAVTISGPVIAPTAAPLTVQDYSLDLRLDPASSGADGVARFTIRNDGAAPVTALPLHLNDGLRLSAATVHGRASAVHNSPQFGTVTLAPALAPGHSAAVRVAYVGHIKLLHAQYGEVQTGIQNGPTSNSLQQAIFQSYLWNGQAMLYRDGDWYPLPWTRGVAGTWPFAGWTSSVRLGWRELTLRLPAAVSAAASTTTVRHDDHSQVFSWHLSGRLPRAVLAVMPSNDLRVAVPGGAVYAPDGGAATVRARYGPYVAALRDLDRFFGHPVQSVTVVAIPLPIPSYPGSPVSVALGDGLVLVQLHGVDALVTSRGVPLSTSRLAVPAPYRAALADLATAWWADHLAEQSMVTILNAVHPLNPLPLDLPNGYVGVTEQGGNDLLLPDYTAAATAAQRLGPGYYAREMALRRTLAAMGRRTGPNNQQIDNIVYLGKGPRAAQLRALGLLGRLDDGGFSSDASPALDDLRQAIGAERVRHDVITLSTVGATPNDNASVACTLDHLTGKPLTAWANSYLNRYAAITPARGCR